MSSLESKSNAAADPPPSSVEQSNKMDTHKLIKKQITYSEGLQTNFFHNYDNTTLITTASKIAHTNEYTANAGNTGSSDKQSPSAVVNSTAANHHHARMTNRTSSFSNQLMPSLHHKHQADHNSQEQVGKLYSTCSVIESNPDFLSHSDTNNKLHRSKEIENLHDEQLEYSTEEEKKSEMERNDLLHHKSHMMRTAEVENLNELANDD